MRLAACLTIVALAPLAGAEWSWPITTGAATPEIAVCTFKYGKTWAYAVEIDDGPKWALDFAVPFLAEHQWTDAPPGVGSGTRRPFVGGVGIIVNAVGGNDTMLGWHDLEELRAHGWGVINHSYGHSGRSWGDESGRMNDQQVQEDAYWSQALTAFHLAGHRAPTAFIYANGYTDYNRGGALEAVGIRIATRVGGTSTTDITRDDVRWMDFPRNYLDEQPWTLDQKADPLAGIPAADGDGPGHGQFIIDFTHGIDQKPDSENQKRWRVRLGTIAKRFGAAGTDDVWSAPTAEIADYVHAAKVAKVAIVHGRITVSIPDGVPGSALTLRLTHAPAGMKIEAPPGGVVYRKADTVWLTTPVIGAGDAPPPAPRLSILYQGPPGTIDLHGAQRIAGISVHLGGHAPKAFSYRVVAKTASGDVVVADARPDLSNSDGWVNNLTLHALVPTHAALIATSLEVPSTDEVMREVIVWGVDDAAR